MNENDENLYDLQFWYWFESRRYYMAFSSIIYACLKRAITWAHAENQLAHSFPSSIHFHRRHWNFFYLRLISKLAAHFMQVQTSWIGANAMDRGAQEIQRFKDRNCHSWSVQSIQLDEIRLMHLSCHWHGMYIKSNSPQVF